MNSDEIIGMNEVQVEDNLLNILEGLIEYINNRSSDEDNREILDMLSEGLENINEVFNNNWETVLL